MTSNFVSVDTCTSQADYEYSFCFCRYLSGYHVTVYNHTPGPCRLIPGVGMYIYFILSSEINVYQKWIN